MHGYDGGKKVSGRKRHLLAGTLGIVLKAHVSAANVGDRDGAAVLLEGIGQAFPRLAFAWADQGYRGAFPDRTGCRHHRPGGGPPRRRHAPYLGPGGRPAAGGAALCRGAPPLGDRAHVRLAGPVPPPGQGL